MKKKNKRKLSWELEIKKKTYSQQKKPVEKIKKK